MNKILRTIVLTVLLFFLSLSVTPVLAQSTGSLDNHTAREEQEGKEIWEKLQAKEVSCDRLSDDDFGALGEYFMGQMMGDSHAAMNEMMTRAHGEDGEHQIHIAMGKRLSECNPQATFPTGGMGWMPMMQMMWGGQQAPFSQTGDPMMWSFWGGFNSWLFNLSLIVWLVVGVLAAIWLFKQVGKR